MLHDSDENSPAETELALRALAARLKMSSGAIHAALLDGKTKGIEATPLYQRGVALADQRSGSKQPRALAPRIKLGGPKIKRSLTTDWYGIASMVASGAVWLRMSATGNDSGKLPRLADHARQPASMLPDSHPAASITRSRSSPVRYPDRSSI